MICMKFQWLKFYKFETSTNLEESFSLDLLKRFYRIKRQLIVMEDYKNGYKLETII